jgi:PIN domain nuclease of toxin-antitoxin system
MRCLLDTHTFLWATADDGRLSRAAAEIFTNGNNELFLSVASVWEIVIKVQIGKLPLPSPVAGYVKRQLAVNRVQTLPVSFEHVLRVEQLPLHHGDPFDRILVAQSMEEKMPIISGDPIFKKYPAKLMW